MPKKKQKKRDKKREYPLYTRKMQKLTDIRYLVNHMVARTAEARLTLAALPALSSNEQWQLMHSVLGRQASGNSESERLYRLLNEAEPYCETFIRRIPDTVHVETARKSLEAAGIR